MSEQNSVDQPFMIGEHPFQSRLIMGTGKFRNTEEMSAAFEAGGTQMITVALRRLDLDDPSKRTLLDEIDWKRYQVLPNTAGCKTADEAVRVARLARAMGLSPFIKLEVIPDPKYLLPDPVETLNAARILVDDGFVVMPYINDDPVLARRMEEAGCATVMPLAAPIGSGMGFDVNFEKIRIIREMCTIPVIVDAGLGVPSDAAIAMEMGCDAVLVNSAIALAKDPPSMARAFRLGVEAGRLAHTAGRMPRKVYAAPTSPSEGIVR